MWPRLIPSKRFPTHYKQIIPQSDRMQCSYGYRSKTQKIEAPEEGSWLSQEEHADFELHLKQKQTRFQMSKPLQHIYLTLILILSRDRVTLDGYWVDDRIYWTL
jgi:hypothetical protein